MDGNGYIRNRIFIAFIVIIFGCLAGLLGYLMTTNSAVTNIRVDIAEIKSDVGWIKDGIRGGHITYKK